MSVLICENCGKLQQDTMKLICSYCNAGAYLAHPIKFDPDSIKPDVWSIWRYEAMIPAQQHITLGEGMTPLVKTNLNDFEFYAKCEFLNPTGSYKDRGVAVMMNHLAEHGATDIAEESSGNAGASVSAYANALGMRPRIFSPATAPQGKQRQMKQYGAEVVLVEGNRDAVNAARAKAVDEGAVYASHSYSPFFIAGQMTAAWEVWEQLGKNVPDAIALPVGQGGFLLGYYYGFKAMKDAGVIDRLPRIFAIQTRACDPIIRAWEQNLGEPEKVIADKTVADGIVIPLPVRGRQIIRALRKTDGGAIRVEEDTILPARDALAKKGLFVEPTSATTIAVLDKLFEIVGTEATLIVNLTGNGLKASV